MKFCEQCFVFFVLTLFQHMFLSWNLWFLIKQTNLCGMSYKKMHFYPIRNADVCPITTLTAMLIIGVKWFFKLKGISSLFHGVSFPISEKPTLWQKNVCLFVINGKVFKRFFHMGALSLQLWFEEVCATNLSNFLPGPFLIKVLV